MISEILKNFIAKELSIEDLKNIEIETKKRLDHKDVSKLESYLEKNAKHIKTSYFIDQFLDTPNYDIFKKGASLRLRYKKDGSFVYLQYKGPGFIYKNIIFRSEFSSDRIKDLVKEESKSKIIHFTKSELNILFSKYVDNKMKKIMTIHLGKDILNNITVAPVICFYKKEKFIVDYGNFYLEPSLDRLNAFHINKNSFHSLSNFWEYENEIKSDNNNFEEKILNLKFLIKFDEKINKNIKMYSESNDKYHRIMSFFVKKKYSPRNIMNLP